MLAPSTPLSAQHGAVLALFALCALISLWLWVYQFTRHAAWRGLWVLSLGSIALALALRAPLSAPMLTAATALAIVISTAYFASAFNLSPRSPWQRAACRAAVIAYLPAALLGAAAWGSASHGLLAWHAVQLMGALLLLARQWRRGHAAAARLGASTTLLITTTCAQYAVILGVLPGNSTLSTVWLLALLASAVHITLDAAFALPRTLSQSLADRDWQHLLMLRYQESAARRSAKAAEGLREDLQQSRCVEARQRDMLTLAAQEFRAPAAQISSALPALRAAGASSAPLDTIEAAAARLHWLATQLLSNERWHDRCIAPQFTALDLGGWLQDIVDQTPATNAATLSLTPPRSALCVEADPVLLDIALRMLIHSATGPAPCSVTLSLARQGANALLHIDSDAPAIPGHLRAKAFDRYLSLSGEPQRGQGLAMVRAIAELHDGSVTLTPHLSGTSRFSLSLPLAPEVCKSPLALDAADTQPQTQQ